MIGEVYDPIQDKMSLINDWLSKHNVVERFISLLVTITWAAVTFKFTVMPVVSVPETFYYTLTGAMLLVTAFQFFGIKMLQMILDTYLKFKQLGGSNGTDVSTQ